MMSDQGTRLFFGNPGKRVEMKPVPQGRRLAFGEPTPQPAKSPMLPPGAKVLAFGNSPQNPHKDFAFKVVDGTPIIPEHPPQ